MRRTMLACAGVALALAAVAGSAPGAHAAPIGARADWSAGPVGRWTGYLRPGGSRRVREVQRRLDRLGYRVGPVDGRFGPRTERAAIRFQRRSRLAADGLVGRRTLRAIRMRDEARLASRPSGGPPRAVAAPARVPAPVAQAPAPPDDFARDVPWIAIALLAAIAGGGLIAMTAERRHRPGGRQVLEPAPRRELVAESETHLLPRFTRPAERPALGAARIDDG
jgi:hypothetical protein